MVLLPSSADQLNRFLHELKDTNKACNLNKDRCEHLALYRSRCLFLPLLTRLLDTGRCCTRPSHNSPSLPMEVASVRAIIQFILVYAMENSPLHPLISTYSQNSSSPACVFPQSYRAQGGPFGTSNRVSRPRAHRAESGLTEARPCSLFSGFLLRQIFVHAHSCSTTIGTCNELSRAVCL